MRKFLICFLLLTATTFAGPLNFTIVRNPYYFSTYFEMMDDDGYLGRAIKPAIHVKSIYELYDADGTFVGEGRCRLLSSGILFNWARDIDVYNEAGACLGLISGTVWSTAKAKYFIYNAAGVHVMTAWQNLNKSGFTLNDPRDRVIGFIRHNKLHDEEWEVTLYQRNLVDIRVMQAFAAFVCDQFSS